MKRLVITVCCMCLILAPGAALAKKGHKGQGNKGPMPNESAYESASENAKFMRGEDWQSGQGKQPQDGKKVLEKKEKKVKEQEKEKEKHSNKKMKQSE